MEFSPDIPEPLAMLAPFPAPSRPSPAPDSGRHGGEGGREVLRLPHSVQPTVI